MKSLVLVFLVTLVVVFIVISKLTDRFGIGEATAEMLRRRKANS